MGNSSILNICEKWSISPLNICTYGIACSVFYGSIALIILITYLIKKVFYGQFNYHTLGEHQQTNATRREGPLTKSFIAVILFTIALIFLPWIYYFSNIDDFKYVTSFYIWASCNTLIWIIALMSLFRDTHRTHPSVFQIFLYAHPILLSVPVIVYWKQFLGNNPLDKSYFIYSIVEVSLSTLSLILIASYSTLRDSNNMNGKWVEIEKAIYLVAHYIWPKEEVMLQIRIYICVLLLVIGRITNIIYPLYTKWIIDDLSQGIFCYRLIIISSLVKFLQGSAMGGFLNTFRSQLWIPVSQHTTMQVQSEMFLHLHRLSLRWHLSRKTGEIIRIMDRGTKSIQTLLMYIVFNVAPTIIDIIIATTVFFVAYNFYFGSLVFVTMVIYLIATVVITEWRTQHRRDMNKAENQWQFIGVDSLLNCETVKQFCAEMKEYYRYRSAVADYQKAEYKNSTSLNLLNFIQNLIIGGSMTIGCILIGYFITQPNGGFTSGDYVMFTTYLLQLFGPLNFFGTLYRTIQNAFVDMENMFEFLDEKIDVPEPENPEPVPEMPFDVKFDNVHFHYNSDQPVLKGVSFTANAGDTIGIVGSTGSGKSTMIRCLFRLYDVTDGSIRFNNIDIRRFSISALRSRIGIVPQDVVLFNDTVEYNISYGKIDATREEIIDAAKSAQIHDFIMSLPNQYDTVVGERGLKLSGGERQRMAIARTLLRNPSILLLDEATSALDYMTEGKVQDNFETIAKNKIAFVVAHRLSTVRNATKIVVLKEGLIVESGTHDTLLESRGEYYRLWSMQYADRNEE